MLITNIVITIIFILVAILLLFPSNRYIPIDRRLITSFGGSLCIIIQSISNHNKNIDSPGIYINIDVLVILLSIMSINFILIRQRYIVYVISDLLYIIRSNINYGFWLVSIISFLSSALITNDGLCLLLTDPILDAFLPIYSSNGMANDISKESDKHIIKFSRYIHNCVCNKSKYFTRLYSYIYNVHNNNNNINKSLTDINNNVELHDRQIDSIIDIPSDVHSDTQSDKLPDKDHKHSTIDISNDLLQSNPYLTNRFYFCLTICTSANIGSAMTFTGNPQNIIVATYLSKLMSGGLFFSLMLLPAFISWFVSTWFINYLRRNNVVIPSNINNNNSNTESDKRIDRDIVDEEIDNLNGKALSNQLDNNIHGKKVNDKGNIDEHILDTTIPLQNSLNYQLTATAMFSLQYVCYPLFLLLILLEFLGYLPLISIFTLIAIYMYLSIIFVNYYLGIPKYWVNTLIEIKLKDRIKLIQYYIDLLFADIDYNLLVIFIGIFIVSGSFVSTTIPKTIWYVFAGKRPLVTSLSIFNVSFYILLASQLIGNVALVIMVTNEIISLPSENTQKFGWLIVAWVSTVAGNFTLVGSAANIIVAEKASRHKKIILNNLNIKSNNKRDINSKCDDSKIDEDNNNISDISIKEKEIDSPIDSYATNHNDWNSYNKLDTVLDDNVNNHDINSSFKKVDRSIDNNNTDDYVNKHITSNSNYELSASITISAINHFKVLGVITIISITIGVCILYLECQLLGYV